MDRYSFDELTVGMISKREYCFTEKRVEIFSSLINDKAPIHMDTEFAKLKGYDGRIVHGLFVQSLISGMLGNDVPGPNSVINNLSMKMHHPVFIGQTVNYEIQITALTKAVSAISLIFTGMVEEKIVISGKVLCSFPESSPIRVL